MNRRKFSPEFKIESASLVLDQGYNILRLHKKPNEWYENTGSLQLASQML